MPKLKEAITMMLKEWTDTYPNIKLKKRTSDLWMIGLQDLPPPAILRASRKLLALSEYAVLPGMGLIRKLVMQEQGILPAERALEAIRGRGRYSEGGYLCGLDLSALEIPEGCKVALLAAAQAYGWEALEYGNSIRAQQEFGRLYQAELNRLAVGPPQREKPGAITPGPDRRLAAAEALALNG